VLVVNILVEMREVAGVEKLEAWLMKPNYSN
jgi:hypothetical protein